MTIWQNYMDRRVKGHEAKMPWFLHDKLKCYRFCEENSIPTATVLREFESPAEMDLSGLNHEFVLKPTLQSSTKGVMILKPERDQFYDSMKNRYMTFEAIRSEQAGYFNETRAAGKKIIVERKIEDADGYEIPRDYKAYAFYGRVALVLEINRNTKPSTVSWYDGNFQPVTDGRVTSNPAFVNEVPGVPPPSALMLLALARSASALIPTPFASIDMYNTTAGPIVGEVTLAPGGLYHGKHYLLSDSQQKLMGEYWEEALTKLNQADQAV